MGPLPRKGNMKRRNFRDYGQNLRWNIYRDSHLQKLVTRLESAKRLITQRRKKHWDESDVVLITMPINFTVMI